MDPTPKLDLDRDTRLALEFDELLDDLALRTRSALGADHIRALEPLASVEAVRREQDLVSELLRLFEQGGKLIRAGLPDPRETLRTLSVQGARVDAKELRSLAAVLVTVGELREQLGNLEEGEYPRLAELAGVLPDLRGEARPVLRHVDSEGRLEDSASPELRRIRSETGKIGNRLQRMLTGMLRDPDAEPVIQDDFITQRNGRYVIPVRVDTPRPLEGIVHASSSSGATRFVEPLETVELNNDLVRLAEEERDEIQRILDGWSRALRLRLDEVGEGIERIAELDSLQARAVFGRDVDGVVPRVDEKGILDLRDVRHPLLDRRLKEIGSSCVPLTLALDPADQVLVISGPNTGGKTVALKTLGLAVVMAQSAIPVPARVARLPLYRQLRADIGDHQSIDADLSTFSAHLQSVTRFLEERESPALFLFDEIGSGTEPTEGAALARAILEELRVPGVTVAATTHQRALKAWSFTQEGAVSAAMEFDTETLRPTYRVLIGAAGVSAGLDIAERLGVPRRVVDRARGLLDDGDAATEGYLDRLRELASAQEEAKRQWDEKLLELEERERKLKAKLDADREKQAAEAARKLEKGLEEFRREARRQLGDVRDAKERGRLERKVGRAEQKLVGEQRRQQAELAPELHKPAPDGGPLETPPRPGMQVHVQTLGRTGEVKQVRGKQVDVQLGAMTFAVDVSDLRRPAGGAPQSSPSHKGPAPRKPLPMRKTPAAEPRSSDPSQEIKLLGMTVEESLAELDRFLDRTAMAGFSIVRIVHGHGTGRLRDGVRRFLRGHPHVESFRKGDSHEGGDGATVVTLR